MDAAPAPSRITRSKAEYRILRPRYGGGEILWPHRSFLGTGVNAWQTKSGTSRGPKDKLQKVR